MTAFYDLSTTRQIGMGVGPIPWTAMMQYAEFKELEQDVTEMFVQVIRAMDEVYIEWITAEEEQKRKSRTPSEE